MNTNYPRNHKPAIIDSPNHPDFDPRRYTRSGNQSDSVSIDIWNRQRPSTNQTMEIGNTHNASQQKQQELQSNPTEALDDPIEEIYRDIGQVVQETFRSFKDRLEQKKKKLFVYASLGAASVSLLATINKLAGSANEQTTTSQNSPIESKHVRNLDQGNLQNPDTNPELYDLVTETGMTITLPKDYAVRTHDQKHSIEPVKNDVMNHTSIFTAKEDTDFNLFGEVYVSKINGRLLTKIDNFSHTADGKPTHLKLGVDKDGWVAVDQDYDQAFTPDKE